MTQDMQTQPGTGSQESMTDDLGRRDAIAAAGHTNSKLSSSRCATAVNNCTGVGPVRLRSEIANISHWSFGGSASQWFGTTLQNVRSRPDSPLLTGVSHHGVAQTQKPLGTGEVRSSSHVNRRLQSRFRRRTQVRGRSHRFLATGPSQSSVSPLPAEDRTCCALQNLSIHRERPVIDVAQVEMNGFLPRQIRSPADWPKACHAWPDKESASDSIVVGLDL